MSDRTEAVQAALDTPTSQIDATGVQSLLREFLFALGIRVPTARQLAVASNAWLRLHAATHEGRVFTRHDGG